MSDDSERERIADYEVHEAAAKLPMMREDEFDGLVESMKVNGWLGDPVVLLGDVLLDGRNRVRAAKIAGVMVPTRQATEREAADPVEFVRTNINRRHLTDDQRAAYAAELATLGRGRPSKNTLNRGISTGQAAKEMRATPQAVEKAKTLRKEAPELHQKVMTGEKTARQARAEAKERKPAATPASPPEPQVRPALAPLAKRGKWTAQLASQAEARLYDLEDSVAAALVEQADAEDWSAERLHNEAAVAALSEDMRPIVREKLREAGDDVASMSPQALTQYLQRLGSLHPPATETMPMSAPPTTDASAMTPSLAVMGARNMKEIERRDREERARARDPFVALAEAQAALTRADENKLAGKLKPGSPAERKWVEFSAIVARIEADRRKKAA